MNIQELAQQNAGEEPEITRIQFLSPLVSQKRDPMEKDRCTPARRNTITHPLQNTPTQLQDLHLRVQPETPSLMGLVV
jgi:hypothetical protein